MRALILFPMIAFAVACSGDESDTDTKDSGVVVDNAKVQTVQADWFNKASQKNANWWYAPVNLAE